MRSVRRRPLIRLANPRTGYSPSRSPMPTYRVRFIKTVINDTGHERRICQRAIEVRAETRAAAISQSRAVFCEREGIADCSQRSDCCEADLVTDTAAPPQT